jgi:hypothetical protein
LSSTDTKIIRHRVAGSRARATGRAHLDLGAHLGADPAVETAAPPAVGDLVLGKGVLPVVPQPVAVQPRVDVVPGQDLDPVPLPCREPVHGQRRALEDRLGGPHPTLEGEVLTPPVEPAALPPHRLDDCPNATVAAREQALDDSRLAVVVAEADGGGIPAVGADRVAQRRRRASVASALS